MELPSVRLGMQIAREDTIGLGTLRKEKKEKGIKRVARVGAVCHSGAALMEDKNKRWRR